ncbi:hypothetical protein N0V94_001264 [Neodidymelliopsis sp. IMI 364377]|nr:hypothetical protein N0V94_001264 [Neodidymelliopsis sp. IMI 364377]
MAPVALYTVVFASTLVFLFILHRFRVRSSQIRRSVEDKKPQSVEVPAFVSESALQLIAELRTVLPYGIIFTDQDDMFKELMNSHWAQQECEVVPACIIRPRTSRDLAQAVKIFKNTFRLRKDGISSKRESGDHFFAIRSGGHSPVAGAASIKDGILIDMAQFNHVSPSPDGNSVVIGAGCKWIHVSSVLEEKGLAIVGGRNSAVGVGGLTLGGGLSFFSPRFGFVCSNILEYQIVLADGTVTTASATASPDLWRALKGGSNNFGIVTSFTAKAFPSEKIWSGFIYMLPSQATNVLLAFHDFLDQTMTDGQAKTYDECAAGPLACFTYLSKLHLQAVAVNLAHTGISQHRRRWPDCWRSSRFASLWRLWSTCTVRSLTSATDELNVLNPPGRRQTWNTTTIKNDPATLEATHKAYRDGIVSIQRANIKDVSWTLVLQPLLPEWARKGQSNPLGLDEYSNEPLVIVQFTVNWALSKDDDLVEEITRAAIEQIDTFADQHQTGNRYRYLNYCAGWQKPFNSYGEENLEFLKAVSQKYDPDGLFQRGCAGGFKLGL